MVKVTFEQDEYDSREDSGDFVFAVVGKIKEETKTQDNVTYMLGHTNDQVTITALAAFIGSAVDNAVDPDSQAAAYRVLHAAIEMKLTRMEKEETPEAATSGESV